MIDSLFILAVSLFLVIKGATFATKYAARLADGFHLSKYTIGFIIIAVISILPELFISVNSALQGVPSFGLGMLFGSNVADMTLIFAILILLAGRGVKVETKILKDNKLYPFFLLLPLVLGWDGYFSRLDGAALILAGIVFYYSAFKNGSDGMIPLKNGSGEGRAKNFAMLILAMVMLLVGAHFTVTSASDVAIMIGISPVLIGMLIVGLGTTMPELFFALKAIKAHDDSLAVGDILGTVLVDATIIVGLLALINPFLFPQKIIYVTGVFMVAASIMLFRFMRSGKVISKAEGYLLFSFWLIFVLVEFLVNR